jgi:hypothetical protein
MEELEGQGFFIQPETIKEAVGYLEGKGCEADVIQNCVGVLSNFGMRLPYYSNKGLKPPDEGVDSVIEDIRSISENITEIRQLNEEISREIQTLQGRRERASEENWKLIDKWYLENEKILEKLKSEAQRTGLSELSKLRDKIEEEFRTVRLRLNARYGITDTKRGDTHEEEAWKARRRSILLQQYPYMNSQAIENMADSDWKEREKRPVTKLTEYERSGFVERNDPFQYAEYYR